MSNFYIADTHFGHANVLRFDGRPFESVAHMEEELVRRWNSVVKKQDTVYVLGDFCWSKEPEWLRILERLKGHIVLIRGNHDLKKMSAELKNQFADIKDYKEVHDNGRTVIMSHYPHLLYRAAYREDVYMLCGHVHTTRENELLEKWRSEMRTDHKDGLNRGQIINVGCMMPYMDYTPRTLDELVGVLDG